MMKNKYFILALTFLCLFIGKNSYSQDYFIPPQFDDDFVLQVNTPTSTGVNELREVVVNNNYTKDYSGLFLQLQQFYSSQQTSTVDYGGGSSTTTFYYYVTPPPTVVPQNPCLTAALANHVYNAMNGNQIAGNDGLNANNVTMVSPSELPSDIDVNWSDPSGFNSALYKVDNGDGTFGYVYATGGTDDLNDVVEDVEQGLGFDSVQYDISKANAIKLANWASSNGYSLSFTGHSLGGGLANANALATGLPATIYNPAGLNSDTVSRLGLNLSNSDMVTAYVVRGEPVDVANYLTSSSVRGTTNYVGSYVDPFVVYGVGGVITASSFGTGVLALGAGAYSLHSMDSVITGLDCN